MAHPSPGWPRPLQKVENLFDYSTESGGPLDTNGRGLHDLSFNRLANPGAPGPAGLILRRSAVPPSRSAVACVAELVRVLAVSSGDGQTSHEVCYGPMNNPGQLVFASGVEVATRRRHVLRRDRQPLLRQPADRVQSRYLED